MHGDVFRQVFFLCLCKLHAWTVVFLQILKLIHPFVRKLYDLLLDKL